MDGYASQILDTPIGPLLIEASEIGITRIEWHATDATDFNPDQPVPAQSVVDLTITQLQEYFAGTRCSFDLPLDISDGSDFQRLVWKQLAEIPYGETMSYGEIASVLGHEGAARAVGTACAKNPTPILVPCHRVLAANGKLGGFAGGLDTKRFLLGLEQRGSL